MIKNLIQLLRKNGEQIPFENDLIFQEVVHKENSQQEDGITKPFYQKKQPLNIGMIVMGIRAPYY